MIRISCVSYLNSQPFLYGLEHYDFSDEITLYRDHPAECARKLVENEADIGLIPIAAIPLLDDAEIITDFCISSNGNVKSVLLVSDVPLEEITTILLDYHSMTSVNLVKVLASHFWKINPGFVNGEPGFHALIKGATAAVIIGDDALKMGDRFAYSYDLAGEWTKMTGMPFVFACWVANSSINEKFKIEFSQALQQGLNSIDAVIEGIKSKEKDFYGLEDYLKSNLNFRLDKQRRDSMKLFLNYLNDAMELNFKVTH